ncbi:MAG: helix-turn-helix domain-containing protein [Bacteroidota bacterium]
MEQSHIDILDRARDLFYREGVRNVSMDKIAHESGISKYSLLRIFKNKQTLVEKLLDQERESFTVIFSNYNFDGVNAIDILLTVSKEMSINFKGITPSLTFDLQKYYPEIYNKHVDDRIEFIFGKIKINLEKGINQGVYRNDLSVELVARLYMRRLIDLHNPEFFPPDKFSFQTLFDVMFDHFIRGIANEKGIEYYEHQKTKVTFNNTN